MLLAAYEYYNLTRQGGYRPLWIPALLCIAALYLNALLRPSLPFDFAPLILGIGVALPPSWELTRREHEGFLLNWALMILGIVYIGGLGSYMFALRNLENGAALLYIPLLTTWLTDMFAYIAGRYFGRTPFFSDISPKKTREGAIGGIAMGTLVFAVLAWLVGIAFWLALIGGISVALLTTAGDLTESLIKRNLGVKDSGTLIAGHGGVFDRLDSQFLALPFAYFFFMLITNILHW